MADVHKIIRSALETQLANVSGSPQIAYEGVSFVPTTGTSTRSIVTPHMEGRRTPFQMYYVVLK